MYPYPSAKEIQEISKKFNNDSLSDLKDLLNALETYNYKWNPTDKSFYNTELNNIIKAESLHYFDSKSIIEKWSNKEFIKKQRDLKFLTKVIFWGFLLLIISSIVLLILKQVAMMITLLAVGIILLLFVELTRKYYNTDRKKGIKPTTLTSIVTLLALLNIAVMFITNGSKVFGATFVLLGLSAWLLFRNLEEKKP